MSAHCCEHEAPPAHHIVNLGRYRTILWIALGINGAMFFVEIAAGLASGSLSLMADAIDFAGDALNYGVSLAVLASALAWRSRAALVKGVCMVGFGVFVLVQAVFSMWHNSPPDAPLMGGVAVVALAANVQLGEQAAQVAAARNRKPATAATAWTMMSHLGKGTCFQ